MNKAQQAKHQAIGEAAERSRATSEALAREFAAELLKDLGLLLGSTPYAEWPRMAQIAFEHTQSRARHAATIYKEFLPK